MNRIGVLRVWGFAAGFFTVCLGVAAAGPVPAFLYATEGAGTGKILRYGADGRVSWEYPAAMSRDVQLLKNGNVLFCYNDQYDPKRHDNPSGVMEVTADKRVVFHFRTTGQIWSCERLDDGNTMVGHASRGQLLIVDREGKVVRTVTVRSKPGHSCMRHARALENGHFLVAESSANAVREYDAEGRMMREIVAPFPTFSMRRLAGGTMLISGRTGIIEVDAADRVVWRFDAAEHPELGIRWLTGFDIRENGNVVVVNAGGKAGVFEITHDQEKRIVWRSDEAGIETPIAHGISLTMKMMNDE